MKKYSSREKRLLRWAIIAIAFFFLNGQWKNYQAAKQSLRIEIGAERANTESYTQRLNYDPQALISETEAFQAQLDDFQDRVLRMDRETEAQFRFQEDVSKMGEKAQINMSSASKRNSKMVLEETGLMEIKTYFTFDCEIGNLLNFFDDLQHSPYYVAIESMTINSYSNRRARPARNKSDRDEITSEEKLRGTAILTALFRAGKPVVKSIDQPEEQVPANLQPEPSEGAVPVPETDANGRVPVPERQAPTDKKGVESIGESPQSNTSTRLVKPQESLDRETKERLKREAAQGEDAEPPKQPAKIKPQPTQPESRSSTLPPKPKPVSPDARQKNQ